MKIVIGKRLLIYVAKPVSDDLINRRIPELAEMGRLERDNKGYNRFRLVVVLQSDNVISQSAMEHFNKSIRHNEKAHIHFVSQNEVPNVLETAELALTERKLST